MSKFLSLILFISMLAATATAHAEGCGDDDGKGDGKFVVEERNGQKVYVIKQEITVCGKVPKPSVVYVLAAKQITYSWENLTKDFLPRIMGAAREGKI